MEKMKIGLLPLYLKLYDDEQLRVVERVDGFCEVIKQEFVNRDLDVILAPICRIKEEFINAVDLFESNNVDAIVTLHLAYSPSLESIDALSSTKIPIIVCDTTPTFEYGPDQDTEELMFNHGIHGVQDMCNLLLRRGKAFQIEAGHWKNSDVLERVVAHISSARMYSHFLGQKVGIIGEPFKGMGDFFIPEKKLMKDFNIEICKLESDVLTACYSSVSDEDISKEIDNDKSCFAIKELDQTAYKRSIKTQLALEKWISDEQIKAFSFNFLNITSDFGFETVPFLAASKLMSRGIGYGGEGDLLTASLVSSLMSVFPETSFTEMFCPDWAENRIFLSHMGELNYKLTDGKARLIDMDYRFSEVENPVYAVGRFKPGKACITNLLPLAEGYRLIISPIEITAVTGVDRMQDSPHGWFKPENSNISDYLAEYSRLGGTHHLALTYTEELETIREFGIMMGFDVVLL